MSGFSRKKGIIFLLSCVLFVLISVGILFCYRNYLNRNVVSSSVESGIHGEGTLVELSLYRSGKIYYSMNGTEMMEYVEPIILSAGEHGQWYELSYYGVFDDGSVTQTQERNYFITRLDEKPVVTDYVVSVWGNEDELFGEEAGLLVRGNQYKEYMEKNPDVNVLHTIVPANYFSNNEIAVQCVIFDRSGNELFDMNCGFNIYGAVSRVKNQKSFRLTARYIYGDKNSFDYAFFPQLLNAAGGQILEYKKLSFHNSGNDNGYGFIRNQMCGELARQQGFQDVLVSESVSVYINNRYMGVYWLQNAFGEKYFKEKYGAYDGEMVVLEGQMMQVASADEEDDTRIKYAAEYNEFCRWVLSADMQDDFVWQTIANTIDVENFIQYVAIEYYINNKDWPDNNLKVYRYVAPDGKYYDESVFDGRYRYLLYDLDYGMGLKVQGFLGKTAYSETLHDLCYNETISGLFGKIMERQECRNMFVNEVIKLINGSFTADNVIKVRDELNGSRYNELLYMLEKSDVFKNSEWETDDYFTLEHMNQELTEILNFAKQRPGYVIQEMTDVLGSFGNIVTLEVDTVKGISVSINDATIVTAQYPVCLSDVMMKIAAKANKGITIKGYFINDTYMEGAEIQIVPREYEVEGKLKITPDWVEQECESLCIEAYRTGGQQDYVVLKNDGNVNIRLSEYYLSDDEEDIFKKQLTDKILEPGERVTFYGEKTVGESVDMNQLSFSWNDEEFVILSNVASGIVEKKALGILGVKYR